MASNYEGGGEGHHACLEMDVGRFRFEVINPHKELAVLTPEAGWPLEIPCLLQGAQERYGPQKYYHNVANAALKANVTLL